MILLSRGEPTPRTMTGEDLVLVIGRGLIGSECLRLLMMRDYRAVLAVPSAWNHPEQLQGHLHHVITHLESAEARDLRIVWAAGKAGFGARQEETQCELADFKCILSMLDNECRLRRIRRRLYLVSSAGGLFEGQLLVDEGSIPRPLRPYGRLKLDQEAFATDLNCDHLCIFRPTSVYGRISATKRMGLIPRLILNAKLGHVTTMYGRSDTLRDYVSVHDVARAIVGCVEEPATSSVRKELVCSGKPSSLFELQNLIEQLVRSRLFLAYVEQSNSESMTFRPCRLSRFYAGGGLRERVTSIYLEWQVGAVR